MAHSLDAGVHVHHSWVVLTRGTEQSLALDKHGVILVDDRTQVLVLQAYIGRNDFLFVGRIVDIVAQEFYQAYLGLVFDAQLFVFGVFLQGKLGIAGQVGQSRFLLEVRQLGFGAAQFLIDDADTVFDEVCRLLCHLVLLVVGILIVEGYQAVDKVGGTLSVGIFNGYLGDGGGFRSWFYRQAFTVCFGDSCRCTHIGCQADIAAFLSLPFVQDGVVCCKAEHTRRGGEYGWEFVEGLFRFLFFLVEGIAYLDIQFAFGAVAQLQLCACLQLFRLFGRHEYVDRRALVQRDVVAQHTVLCHGSVKSQLGYYLADQGAAFQDFHLIVEVVAHG